MIYKIILTNIILSLIEFLIIDTSPIWVPLYIKKLGKIVNRRNTLKNRLIKRIKIIDRNDYVIKKPYTKFESVLKNCGKLTSMYKPYNSLYSSSPFIAIYYAFISTWEFLSHIKIKGYY